MPAAGQHRPQIVLAEQPVGGALHEEQIVQIGADAAENPEDQLHEHRRLEQAAIDQMGEIVEVAGVVAFVLEFDAVALAQRLVDFFDVAKRVGENVGVGIGQIALLPIVFPVCSGAPSDRARNSSTPYSSSTFPATGYRPRRCAARPSWSRRRRW